MPHVLTRRAREARATGRAEDASEPILAAVMHNISGHALLNAPVLRTVQRAARKVPRHRHFGKTHILYSTRGNVIFCPGEVGVHFKGARDAPSLFDLLSDITDGDVLKVSLGMIVLTMHLQINVDVRPNAALCTFLQELNTVHCGSIQRMILADDVNNTVYFKIKRWEAFVADSSKIDLLKDAVAVVNITCHGNCTVRMVFAEQKTLPESIKSVNVTHAAVVALGQILRSRLTATMAHPNPQ